MFYVFRTDEDLTLIESKSRIHAHPYAVFKCRTLNDCVAGQQSNQLKNEDINLLFGL